jgi:plasmid stability protein
MTDLHIYVPEELAAALKAQAQKNQRSITGEVRYILETNVAPIRRTGVPPKPVAK